MKTICIMCPMGCHLEIEERDGVVCVSGNTCPRGAAYGRDEYTRPKRTVTSLARLSTGGVVPVKTESPVDKNLIKGVLEEIGGAVLVPPLSIGDVAVPDAAGSGVDVVVTADVR